LSYKDWYIAIVKYRVSFSIVYFTVWSTSKSGR